MFHAKVLKKLIYKGKVYNVGDFIELPENILVSLEGRGVVQRLLGDENSADEVLEPVAGLPTLEEELKAKSKKK